MRRLRTSLSILSFVAIGAANAGAQVMSTDVRELPADQQIMQALNRLTFGPRPGDIQKVRAIGLDKWIDIQLHPDQINDSAIESFMSKYSVLNQDQNSLLTQYAEAQRARQTVRRELTDTAKAMTRQDSVAVRQQVQQQFGPLLQLGAQLQSERVARAVGSERQLEEVMTDFWLNHFNVYIRKGGPELYYLADYEKNVIRTNALGKFRELLESVARSPAMQFYLDNARSMADSTHNTLASAQGRGNRAANLARLRNLAAMGRLTAQQMQRMEQLQQQRPQGLNENYGRELLELHTLGVDGGYTQQDVINVARAFTGWTIKPPPQGGGFVFRPEMHDADEKIVLGHKLAAGRGMEDAEDVLTIVSRSPATAKFIATKLARRFVNDSPPPALVDRAAATFLRTDGDIRETLRTIITSPEFFSQSAFHSKVKSPFEVVASAMRALNAQPDSTPRSALSVAFLGQPIYGHQAPNGWPETGESWMNTGAILNRINFGMAVAAGRLPGVNIHSVPALDTIQNASRAKQVDAVVTTILSGIASPDTRKILETGENPLMSQTTPADLERAQAVNVDANIAAGSDMTQPTQPARPYRPNAGNAGNANARRAALQGRPLGPAPQLTGLAQIVGLALGSPEFQRR